jgi:hypothetical protein
MSKSFKNSKFSQPYNSEISVNDVNIIDINGNLIFSVLNSPEVKKYGGNIKLDFIEFTETLGNYIEGSMIIDGTNNEFELIQGRGNEFLQITATSPKKNQNDKDQEQKQFPIFSIVSVDDASNIVDMDKTPEGYNIRKIKISFCSQEASRQLEESSYIPGGFIGHISSGITLGLTADIETEDPENPENIDVEEVEDQRGLVELLSDTYFTTPIDSESTLNYIWIHPNNFYYPTKKSAYNLSPIQMLNYAKEYAVSARNPTATNYCFWHDLNGWHFKSIDYLISNGLFDVLDESKNKIPTYNINSNVPDRDRIYKLNVIKDYSEKDALLRNTLYSYYIRETPDYESDVFHRLMGDREKYRKTKITYNHKEDSVPLFRLESGDIATNLTYEDIENCENNQNRIYDNLYGWVNSRSFDDNDSVNNFILNGNDVGITSATGGTGAAKIENFILGDFSQYETEMFQEMFDCTSLDGKLLKRIIDKVKRPSFESKRKYRELLSKKEKFNIYRYSVCCDVTSAEEEIKYALLTNHEKIDDNIYRYEWTEVALLPKVEVGNFLGIGITADDIPRPDGTFGGVTQESVFYKLETDSLNQIRLPDTGFGQSSSRPMKFSFVKFPSNPTFRGNVEIDSVGDLSGEFYISATGPNANVPVGGYTFEFENSVTDAIGKYFLGDNAKGLTLTFHNSKYSPFLVVEKPGTATGITGNPSGAYNINEIMNRTIYNENTYPSITGDTIIYYQGEDSPDDYNLPNERPSGQSIDELVGPGINAAKGDITDYPLDFNMQPIGGYRRAKKTINENTVTYENELDCGAIPNGHIVKLSTISYSDLVRYGLDTRDYATRDNKKIYYFSATNAHDGKCDGSCNL